MTYTTFLPELSEEVLIRSSIEVIKNYSMTTSKLYELCQTEHFWIKKLKYNKLPLIPFDDFILKGSNFKSWSELYIVMQEAYNQLMDIMLVNKIEAGRKYNKTNGIMNIELYIYENLTSDDLLNILPKESFVFYYENVLFETNNYKPNLLKIQLNNDSYNLKYIVLDTETENFIQSGVNISKLEMLNILTLLLFDVVILDSTDFDIGGEDNLSMLYVQSDINHLSTMMDRQSLWMTLDYQGLLKATY
jgi:hypothetical protein